MEAVIRFVANSAVLSQEKAFSTDFSVDHVPGAKRTNQEPDDRSLSVSPIDRSEFAKWDLDTHGFCVLRADNKIDRELAFTDKARVKDEYWARIEGIIHAAFPRYSRVEAFDLTAGS